MFGLNCRHDFFLFTNQALNELEKNPSILPSFYIVKNAYSSTKLLLQVSYEWNSVVLIPCSVQLLVMYKIQIHNKYV